MGKQSGLAGKRIVITRAREQSASLANELEQHGAEVLFLPLIRFEPAADKGPLRQALAGLERFDWLVLTSQNAVRFVAEELRELGASVRRATSPKVAAVGTATAEAARSAGWAVDFVAKRFQGLALAEEMGSMLKGKRVLLPRSDRARGHLPEALRKLGADVHELIAYRTMSADVEGSEVAAAIQEGRVDVVTFASPSAVHSFAEAMGSGLPGLAGGMAIAAIGQVTAEAIREAGLPVHVEAEESTAGGLAQAIAAFFAEQRTSSGARTR